MIIRGAVFLLFVLLLLLWIYPIQQKTYGPLKNTINLTLYPANISLLPALSNMGFDSSAGKHPFDWGRFGTSQTSAVLNPAVDGKFLIISSNDHKTVSPPSNGSKKSCFLQAYHFEGRGAFLWGKGPSFTSSISFL